MLISHHNRATSYQRKAASQTVPPLYAAIGRAVNLRFAFADATISADGPQRPGPGAGVYGAARARRDAAVSLGPGITRSWLRCFDRRDLAAVR